MKKLLFTLIFSALFFTLSAQDFEILSVESLPADFSAREEMKTDHGGHQCALLRIATQKISPEQREGFMFKTDLGSELVERVTRGGEIWLWVSPGLKYLRVIHNELGQYEIRMLDYVTRVEPLQTYKITIKGPEVQPVVVVPDNDGNSNSIQKSVLKEEETFTVNGVSFTMKLVEGGTFQMGSNDSDADNDEKPVHTVSLSSYYMGETEVTQALWKAVMGSNPSNFKGDNLPVERVSWNDCQEFIRKLNQATGKNFRLPTEAEWEYAARGKTQTSLYNGESIDIRGENNSPNLDKLAWYGGNCGRDYTSSAGCDVAKGYDISGWSEKQYNDSKGGTHPVGKKQPNAYGLYDMLGNVWEWCQDWYSSDYYGKSPSANPQGPSSLFSSEFGRVLRGGSWINDARGCRVSYRYSHVPGRRRNRVGFRLCLPQ